jgi:hypothetical protein
MNNTWKKDNSVAKGGARAPANHPRKDSQAYAHKILSNQSNPSRYVEKTQVQSHAGSSKKK